MAPSPRWRRRRSSWGAQTPANLALTGSGAGEMHAGNVFFLLLALILFICSSAWFRFFIQCLFAVWERVSLARRRASAFRRNEWGAAESVSNKIFVQLRKICSFVRSLSSMSTKMTTMSGMLNENSRTKESDANGNGKDTKDKGQMYFSIYSSSLSCECIFRNFPISISLSPAIVANSLAFVLTTQRKYAKFSTHLRLWSVHLVVISLFVGMLKSVITEIMSSCDFLSVCCYVDPAERTLARS